MRVDAGCAAAVWMLAVLINSSTAQAGLLETGRAKFFARDYDGAMLDLDAAIALPPAGDEQEAHAIRSVARLARLADTEQVDDPGFLDTVKELLGAFGFAPDQRSVLDWEIAAPRDAQGRLALAPDSPTGGEVQGFLLDPVVVAIEESLEDMTLVSASFSTVVTGAEISQLLTSLGRTPPNQAEDATFALAEWKLWEVALRLAHAKLLLAIAYDLDVDLDELLDPDFVMNVQANVLDPHPNLLTIASGGVAALLGVRSDLFAAIAAYEAASASLRTRGPCCFVEIGEDDADWEQRLREKLADLRTSLQTCSPYSLDWDARGEGPVAPCALLGGGAAPPLVPRSLLPAVIYDPDDRPHNYVNACELSDPTMGGLFPEPYPILTQLAHGYLRPCGDRVEDAIVIGDGEYEGTLRGATPGAGSYTFQPLADPLPDVWYRYTAARDGLLQASACPQNPPESEYGRVVLVSIFSSLPAIDPGGLAYLIGWEFGGGGCELSPLSADPYTEFPTVAQIQAGQTVWIRVSSFEKVSFTLTVPEPGAGATGAVAIALLLALTRRRR